MEPVFLVALGCAAVLGWAARGLLPAASSGGQPRGSRRPVRFEVPGAPVGLRAWPRSAVAELPADLTVSGDEALDRVAVVAGAPAEVLAMLDEPGRRALRSLVEAGLELADGRVRGVAPSGEVPAIVGLASTALELLRPREAPLEELLARLGTEPLPGVRRRIGEVLSARGLEDRVAEATAADPDPQLRLRSARLRGDADALMELLHAPSTDVREAAWRALRDGHLERVVARLSAELLDPDLAPAALGRLAAVPPEARPGVAAAHAHRLRVEPRRYATEGEPLLWLLSTDPEGGSGLLDLARHAPVGLARMAVPHLVRVLPSEQLHDLGAERPELRAVLDELLPAAVDKDRRRRLLRASGLPWSAGLREATAEVDGWTVELRFATAHDVLLVRGVPEVPPLWLLPAHRDEPGRGWRVAAVPEVLAWLPTSVRELAERAADGAIELRIGEGQILCSVVLQGGEDLRGRLGRLVVLAAALTELSCLPPPLRVRRAFVEERRPASRRAFAALAFEADPRLAVACLGDPDLEVRRAAARACGAVDVLVDLVGEPSHPRAERLGALADLELLDGDALSRGIALAWDDPILRAHALLAVGRTRRAEHAGRIAALLEDLGPTAPTLGLPAYTAALEVLVLLDAPDAEPALLRGLQTPDMDLRLRVLAALGRIGSGRSLPTLRWMGEAWTAEGRAARAALAEIRARSGTGGLALAVPEGGAVALVPADGALSEAETG